MPRAGCTEHVLVTEGKLQQNLTYGIDTAFPVIMVSGVGEEVLHTSMGRAAWWSATAQVGGGRRSMKRVSYHNPTIPHPA